MISAYGIGKRTDRGLTKPGRYLVLRFSSRAARGLACALDTDAVSTIYVGRWHRWGGELACPGGKPKRGGGWFPLVVENERKMPEALSKLTGIEDVADEHSINLC